MAEGESPRITMEALVIFWLQQLSGCDGGPCPKLFLGSDGEFYVQGAQVTDPDELAHAGIVEEGEAVVRVPRHIIEAGLEQLKTTA